ncbi:unnamed protein product [Candida verbasci]|uniref:ornithine decarboxylase n=1 Tax=Candida verbasci TaxID=1227364 RepID=A0A9W4TXM9_9ASCO|nr:unnamed protein product [Candida verbasci]
MTPSIDFQIEKISKFQTIDKEFTTNVIKNTLIDILSKIDYSNCEPDDENSFFICNLNQVIKSYNYWYQELPYIKPHYAIKCNTDVRVIKLLSDLGCNFDCASKSEIETILQLGISPDRIVYANPCKTSSYIRFAKDENINLTTVDNVDELYKLSKFHPNCNILVRILTNDETSQCRLSTKFGASIEEVKDEILPIAKKLNLNIVGVAFHVGSGAKDFNSIYEAIRDSRIIFDEAIDLGFNMSILDIGGGFEVETFKESSSMVNFAISKYFPQKFIRQHDIEFIAEPGRFMVSNAFLLCCNVIAKRKSMLYLNDGLYGNLNCILFDHQIPEIKLLKHKNKVYYDRNDLPNDDFNYSIWGPTCDGLDCISKNTILNYDVDIGDWLYFPNLGAYSSCAKTQFNGFKQDSKIIYVFE